VLPLGDVRAYVEGDADRAVPEPLLHDLRVDAGRQRERRPGVPQVVRAGSAAVWSSRSPGRACGSVPGAAALVRPAEPETVIGEAGATIWRVYRLHRHGVFVGEYRTPDELGKVVDLAGLVDDERRESDR